MTLSTGTKLSHYEITSQIGKGGMGEVYQAKDQKLGRDVAIKVLPEEFARDADRVARFQREAKLLASLNHPNIAAIYGLEESDGTHFLVMELIEGQTLDDRIKSGPIPVEDALKLALQIAEALEAAHEKGVIHRDLKPANIKVTPDGKVKVLDFGLAKAFAGEQSDLNLSNSPTLSHAATIQGVILGTAAYMSPEQASGESADKRADIWAFGVVFYEMLTGRSLFAGDNVSQTLARVLERKPDFSTLPPNLHPRICLLLERCLEKNAKDRCHDIADVRVDIQKVLADPSGLFAQSGVTAKSLKKLQVGIPWIVVIASVCIIATGLAAWNIRPSEQRQVVRFSYELPDGLQFGDLMDNRALAISSDGRQVVYSTNEGLYLHRLDGMDSRVISGTVGAQNPFFSHNGKRIGYTSEPGYQLKIIAVSGGSPISLGSVSSRGIFNWGADERIVFGQMGEGVMQVSANDGKPQLLIKAENPATIISPQILPDGKSVLFTSFLPDYTVMVHSLKSGESEKLFAGDAARYLPTGHIVYALESNLYAVPFDIGGLEIKKDGARSIVEGVLREGFVSQYAISDTGTLVYIPGTASEGAPQRVLTWVDRSGKEEPIAAQSDAYLNPRISPDGKRIALGVAYRIAIWDIDLQNRTLLPLDEIGDSFPLWSLDGKRIVFASRGSSLWNICQRAADGTGKAELLCEVLNQNIMPSSWASDGNTLVLSELSIGFVHHDIGMISMGGKDSRQLLLQESYNESQPQISPNGRFIAYTSDESEQNEVYVRSFPEIEGFRRKISNTGGNSPLWSHDGRELFYRNGDAVMAVSIKTEPTFSHEAPKILFRGSYVSYADSPYDFNPWDISPDGKRFLMMKQDETENETSTAGIPRKINVILNWFEELTEKVPVD